MNRTALLTIDMQEDFLDGGSMEVPGTSLLIPKIGRMCTLFRSEGRPVVHLVRLYLADGSNAEPVRRATIRSGTRVVCPGTSGRRIAPGILPDEAPELDDSLLMQGGIQQMGNTDVAIYKPRWGAFFRTPLQDYLSSSGIESLAIVGCNFPNCPRTSIYEASERDYEVTVISDAVSGIYELAVDELRRIGVRVVSAADFVDSLASE